MKKIPKMKMKKISQRMKKIKMKMEMKRKKT
jgi:hypothetical protein